MRKTVIIAGKAGEGIDRTAILLGKALSLIGYYCFIYRDYSSLIRGGHNFSVVTFSRQKVRSHEGAADVLVALDKESYHMHEEQLKEGGKVFSFEKKEGESVFMEKSEQGNISNNALLGAVMAYLDIPFSAGAQAIEKEFPGKNKAIMDIFRKGYKSSGKPLDINLKGKGNIERDILDGNESVAKGAMDAGVQDVFYYPMTPATGVFSKLEAMKEAGGVNVLQMEDEIAVANAALGASYAGRTAFTGSSGGGMALMGEAVSFAGMAELPIVFYVAQRMGPSTGVPTYTSQGDMKSIVNLGPGEFPKMVLVPGDIEESYETTRQAFYFARKYRMPVFIMSDKHIAESYMSVDGFSSDFPKNDFIKKNPGKFYKSYKITKSGVSPAIAPGGQVVFRVTSYEHDEKGYTTEAPGEVKKMNEKRLRKMDALKEELNKYPGISVYGKGKKIMLFTGSPKGAVLDALPSLKGWSAIQVNRLYPFPADELKKKIKDKILVTVENNATALLADLIRESCGSDIKDSILKYDGRPFMAEEVVERVMKLGL